MANLMKPEVLRLYKRIMRLSQTWNSINPSNTGEERRFIKDEARTWFQRNKQVDNIQQIKDHIQEAEARLEMGMKIYDIFVLLYAYKAFIFLQLFITKTLIQGQLTSLPKPLLLIKARRLGLHSRGLGTNPVLFTSSR